ncbi:MAG: PQQ-binding-like beta-propeller repeat protein [Ignavibacteriae bacterium]|nr:PQQ-binding-like beta-propeller repeat protein [Ignavibacteriota bacterium]
MKKRIIYPVFLAALAVMTMVMQAQVLQRKYWIPYSPVRCIAVTDSLVFLGGDFVRIGPYTGNLVAMDPVTAERMPGLPEVNGIVRAIVPDGARGYFIGGNFTRVGVLEARHLVHVHADGTPDRAWLPEPDGEVMSLDRVGDVLIVGGSFRTIGGLDRENLAAVDTRSGMALGAFPSADATVRSVHIAHGTVYVGGDFTTLGALQRSHLAALDAGTGAVRAWDPGVDSAVYCLRSIDSVLYVGGKFVSIGGTARARLAALDLATGTPLPWRADANAPVHALALRGDALYAGGEFTNIGNAARQHIASLHTATGDTLPWRTGLNSTVQTLEVSGAVLYAGGKFTRAGDSLRMYLADFSYVDGSLGAWAPQANWPAFALLTEESRIVAGGQLSSVNSVERVHIAALDKRTGAPTPWNPRADNVVTGLLLAGDTLFVSGDFAWIDGAARARLAAFDAIRCSLLPWRIVGFAPGSDVSRFSKATAGSSVSSLAVHGNRVFLGGVNKEYSVFDRESGRKLDYWQPNPGRNGASTLLSVGDTLFVGGDFLSIGGQPRFNLAAFDARNGSLLSWNARLSMITGSDAVYGLAARNGILYAGGRFGFVYGRDLAAITISTGETMPWAPVTLSGSGNSASIFSLAAAGNTVYAGGNFMQMGGVDIACLAAIDANTGWAKPWNPKANGYVQAITVDGITVYAGGVFSRCMDEYRSYFAAVDDSTQTLGDDRPAPGRATALTIEAPYPNPGLEYVVLRVHTSRRQEVSVHVTDLLGRTILTIADQKVSGIGTHPIRIPVSGLRSGAYICTVTDGEGASIGTTFQVLR